MGGEEVHIAWSCRNRSPPVGVGTGGDWAYEFGFQRFAVNPVNILDGSVHGIGADFHKLDVERQRHWTGVLVVGLVLHRIHLYVRTPRGVERESVVLLPELPLVGPGSIVAALPESALQEDIHPHRVEFVKGVVERHRVGGIDHLVGLGGYGSPVDKTAPFRIGGECRLETGELFFARRAGFHVDPVVLEIGVGFCPEAD